MAFSLVIAHKRKIKSEKQKLPNNEIQPYEHRLRHVTTTSVYPLTNASNHFHRYRRVSRRECWRGDKTFLRRHEERRKSKSKTKTNSQQIPSKSMKRIKQNAFDCTFFWDGKKALTSRCMGMIACLYIDCLRQVHQGPFDRKRQHGGPDEVNEQDDPEVHRVLPPTFSVRRHFPILSSFHFCLQSEK